jgi:hypothetical protein
MDFTLTLKYMVPIQTRDLNVQQMRQERLQQVDDVRDL